MSSNNDPLRCLVIGANGFVGSHIVDKLAEAGYSVRAFDRFSKAPQFYKSDNIEVFKGDFFDDIIVGKALGGMDYVFHSFSATTPFTADSDPYTDVSSNLLRNIQLFERAVEAKVKKIVYLSSGGAVYGSTAENKVASEEDAPEPVSPYGIGKLASELYLAYFKRKYGLDYVSYRLSNPYGPRQIMKHNQGVVPAFIEKMLKNEEITVIGDGTSSRDYIYIEDAASMMTETFLNTEQHLYNLGSGIQTSVNQIIDALEELTGRKALVKRMPEPKTFVKHASINIGRIENEFSLSQRTSLRDGLGMTLSSQSSTD